VAVILGIGVKNKPPTLHFFVTESSTHKMALPKQEAGKLSYAPFFFGLLFYTLSLILNFYIKWLNIFSADFLKTILGLVEL
jgi:hypothetical protein